MLYRRGDRLEACNWRPISLLCADYKIAAKALANRLRNVIDSIVSPDQTCGIPNRFIGENVRLLADIIDYADSCDVGGAMISFDQEKAFDRVEFSFLLNVLERMGFGPSYIGWIKLLYTDVFSAVSINGFLTDFFPVSRGVRQGCPLSPLLYVLAMETLACAVRADQKIDGFPLPGGNKVVKISQYADDTTGLVRSEYSLVHLFSLFSRYERASGAKLNTSKCHGLLLGPWREKSSLPMDITWSPTSITVLGAKLQVGAHQDWTQLFRKIEGALETWKSRPLSLRGRALLANVLAASKLWYLSSVVPADPQFASKVKKLFFNFIWKGRGEWLRRTSVTQPQLSGGLGFVDVDAKLKALKVLWVKRYLTSSDHPWKSFFKFFLIRAFLPEPVNRVFNFSNVTNVTLKRLPLFYQQVLSAWYELGGKQVSGEWVIPSRSNLPLP